MVFKSLKAKKPKTEIEPNKNGTLTPMNNRCQIGLDMCGLFGLPI